MHTIRLSIHSSENTWLRQKFVARRQALGLSQRALAGRLDVVYSFVGKVENGDRRLDVHEFIAYCRALALDPCEVMREMMGQFGL